MTAESLRNDDWLDRLVGGVSITAAVSVHIFGHAVLHHDAACCCSGIKSGVMSISDEPVGNLTGKTEDTTSSS